ncbi:MAG: hypothetical protein RJB68_1584 [Pseudomonadota bacterium]
MRAGTGTYAASVSGRGPTGAYHRHNLRMLCLNFRLLACAALMCATTLHASPRLRCELTYAGSTQTLEATPVDDPYPVASVDVGGRFFFKAVVVGRGAQPEYIKTYAYLDTLTQPVLVQQASYFPPFTAAPGGQRLTGKQFVYAGPVERELQYECVLHGAQP